jgi:glycosyltransferase involved in cell wall biosynthesis
MKILFITSASENAKGGHVHSLFHISSELGKYFDVKIINIGNGDNIVLKKSPYFIGSCNVDKLNILLFKFKIIKLTNNFEPDIVNFFNEDNYLSFKLFSIFKNAKFLLTKCGGKNPNRTKWIEMDNLICFSSENFNWFTKNNAYISTKKFLIPNRVHKVDLLPENERLILKNINAFNFLRIARFTTHYMSSFNKLIDMVCYLKEKGFNIHLILVGSIENKECYNQIIERISNNNIFASIYTGNETAVASKLLYLADCVLGTGRSAMEAMSLGIPVLAPATNSDYPVLLNESNFNEFLQMNFSERANASNEDLINNMFNVEKMISNLNYHEKISNDTYNWFNENLSVANLSKKYSIAFDNLQMEKRIISLNNLLYTLKYWIRL